MSKQQALEKHAADCDKVSQHAFLCMGIAASVVLILVFTPES
jgi:hypothetical protein